MIIVIFFLCTAIFNHVENGFHVLIFNWRFVQQIEHERSVKRRLRFFPERIVCFRALWSGVLDEIVNQLEHVCVLAYVAKRVVTVGFRWVDQVKNAQNITFLQKQISDGTEHFALRNSFVKIENGSITDNFHFRNWRLLHRHASGVSPYLPACPCSPC